MNRILRAHNSHGEDHGAPLTCALPLALLQQRKVWGPNLVVEDTVGDTQTSLELLAEKRGEGRPTHLGEVLEYQGYLSELN